MQYFGFLVILIIEDTSGEPKATSSSSLNSKLEVCSMKLVDSME